VWTVERDESLHQRDRRGEPVGTTCFYLGACVSRSITSRIHHDCSLTLSDVEKELDVLRMFSQVPNDFQSKRSMLNVAGCNEPDDVGRTPLHYIRRNAGIILQQMWYRLGGCQLYCKCCMFLFGIDSSAVFTCIGALGTPSRTGPHWHRQLRGAQGVHPPLPMAGQKRIFC